MKIAVDIDGVLLDIIIVYCKIFNAKYGTNYQKSDVTNWEFYKDWKISEEQAFEIFFEIYEDSSEIPFIDEKAPKVMEELNKSHTIDIVSARVPEYRNSIKLKLQSHDVNEKLQYNKLILLHHKPYDIKLNQNYDIYIDDSPNLVEPIKNLKEKYLLLYDQPWNQDSNLTNNVIRVYNWEDVYTVIRRLEK